MAYPADGLRGFAAALLAKAGLDAEKAAAVAEILLEGDLLGHSTHGLQLLAPYLKALEDGTMAKSGNPTLLNEAPAALTWDGRYLPGPWLVLQAIATAMPRAKIYGTATVVIRRAHHIACLAAYPPRVTAQGMILLLACSDPSVASVAPHGGIAGRITPNPLAAGWPTGGDPVVLDISASTTTNGLTGRLNRQNAGKPPAEHQKLGGPWLVTNIGEATDDPAALTTQPPGAILPLGGMDLGHKGYGLGLLVEALTSGLGGFGRADGPKQWGASVFLQVIDPAAFGGADAFVREAETLSTACRATPVKPGNPPVRLPGERGQQLRREQMQGGVRLHPEIMPALKPWAEKLGVALPPAV